MGRITPIIRTQAPNIPMKPGSQRISHAFDHTLTVYTFPGGKIRKRVYHKNQVYKTDLLPGFELLLARLFAVADRWEREDATPH